MLTLLLPALCLLMMTSCAPRRAARQQVMSTTFTEDGSGLFKMQGRVISWGAAAAGLPFAFDPDFPPDLRVGCVNAARTWNEVLGFELITLSPEDQPFSEVSDGRNVISFGKSPRVFPENHAAETVIHIPWVNPRITEADIDFDVRHFTFGLSGRGREADVETTCLHELGHALGLTHVLNRRSIMNPRITLGQPKRTPSPADVERLQTLYPPRPRPEVP